MGYQQIDTSQPFPPSDLHQQAASPSPTTMQRRTSAAASPASASPAVSQPQAAAAVEPLHLPTINLFQDHSFSGQPKYSKNIYSAEYLRKYQTN